MRNGIEPQKQKCLHKAGIFFAINLSTLLTLVTQVNVMASLSRTYT